jgi:hypothetical protein
MKSFLLLFIFFVAVVIHADNYEKAATLKEDIQKLDIKMHETRVKLIKKDASLKALQEKIIALHKELAIRIDNKTEMRDLIDKKKKLKLELEALENE